MAYKIGEQVSAGDLNHRVSLEAPTYNPSGDEITGHSAVATVWASVEPLRGRELVESGRDVSEQWTRIRIRYRAGLDTIKRAVHGSDIYDIESIIDPFGSRKVLELMCKIVR